MNWQFTIIDRNNIEHIIDEPVGWDACQIVIKRDPELHGIFFDYQGNDFQFNGTAGDMIKKEYDQYGVEGNMIMVIAQACEGQDPEELYRGRLLFSKYEYSCGDECYVKIPIETTGDVMELRNRWDQKVSLQAVYSFNGIHELNYYEKCPVDIVLPSKTIFLQDHAKKEVNTDFNYLLPEDATTAMMIYVPLEKLVAGEIGNFVVPDIDVTDVGPDTGPDPTALSFTDGVNTVAANPRAIEPIINFFKESANYNAITNPCQLSYRFKGHIETPANSFMNNVSLVVLRLPEDKDEDVETDYEVLHLHDIHRRIGVPPEDGESADFDIAIEEPFTLNKGDRIWYFLALTLGSFSGTPELDLSVDAESFFKLTDLSKTSPSVAQLFMINESFSRVAEAITDDKIRVYSDYFGRTDAEPYPSDVDGCGGLEAITKGIFIRRQENRIPDQPSIFAQSMKDLWDGTNPIHHIGMGIEDDPNRAGFKLLRIERWNYFYSDDEIMVCDNVNKIDRATQEKDHYSTIKFGYEKWEAEEYNGLDEFLTKRIYRTTLSQIKNELPILSKMIASGYAWEITRRKGDLDSKDWRYDNEAFIACLKRSRYQIYNPGEQAGASYVQVTPKPPIPFETGDTIELVDAGLMTGTYTIIFVQDIPGNAYVTIEISPTGGGFPEGTYDATVILNGNTLSGILAIELGNVTDPVNIIDPDTLYNFRISPMRNAMRWMDKILASYRKYDPANKIVFTDGEGNCAAEGKMESDTCRLEANVIKENDPISGSLFSDADYPKPKIKPENVKYEYPMSLKDFKRILLNPYGRVTFNNDCEDGTGWIDTITYKPEEGIAQFDLKPKFIE